MEGANLAGRTDVTALLMGVRRGSPEALAALYRATGPLVFGVARRITGNDSDAQDVTQDVFLGLPEALAGFEGRGSFEGWLKKVAARTALMRLRAQRQARGLDNGRIAPVRDHAGAIVDRIDLERAVARLPETLRLVFVLKEVEGHSHTETARLLGITRGASEVRLFRARKMLTRMLEGTR